jgi:magnesium-transporting ATPase (P-type)
VHNELFDKTCHCACNRPSPPQLFQAEKCTLRRFLTRLLLVHGSLSAYRLSRLIKYSFYKNIAFGFLLFYYQFYCGFSGQSMVDDISAAAFNVVFTSLPILLFAVLDRPVHNVNTLLRFPQVCPNFALLCILRPLL